MDTNLKIKPSFDGLSAVSTISNARTFKYTTCVGSSCADGEIIPQKEICVNNKRNAEKARANPDRACRKDGCQPGDTAPLGKRDAATRGSAPQGTAGAARVQTEAAKADGSDEDRGRVTKCLFFRAFSCILSVFA